MLAAGACRLPETGSSLFVVVIAVGLLASGFIAARWVRQSAGRLSVVVAPLVLFGGLVFTSAKTESCESTTTAPVPVGPTTVVPPPTTVVPTTTIASTYVVATTTTVAPTTTLAPTTTTTTTVVLTCANGGTCAVGDTGPGGGIVFYDAGAVLPWGRFLEVACLGWQQNCDGTTEDPTVEWGCSDQNIDGAEGGEIGDGKQNTADIVRDCATDGIAARLADNLVLHGQSEWFLPSSGELNALCKWVVSDIENSTCNNDGNTGNPAGPIHEGFSSSSNPYSTFWSSTENSGNSLESLQAIYRSFADGNSGGSNKNNVSFGSVRPIRAF